MKHAQVLRITHHASRVTNAIAAVSLLLPAILGSLAHADALGDPMRPAGMHAAASLKSVPKGSRLTAIFTSEERRVAVFDGRVVRVGDRVGEVVILEVLADGVRFSQSGRIEVVRLPKTSVVVRRERAAETKTASTVSQEIEP